MRSPRDPGWWHRVVDGPSCSWGRGGLAQRPPCHPSTVHTRGHPPRQPVHPGHRLPASPRVPAVVVFSQKHLARWTSENTHIPTSPPASTQPPGASGSTSDHLRTEHRTGTAAPRSSPKPEDPAGASRARQHRPCHPDSDTTLSSTRTRGQDGQRHAEQELGTRKQVPAAAASPAAPWLAAMQAELGARHTHVHAGHGRPRSQPVPARATATLPSAGAPAPGGRPHMSPSVPGLPSRLTGLAARGRVSFRLPRTAGRAPPGPVLLKICPLSPLCPPTPLRGSEPRGRSPAPGLEHPAAPEAAGPGRRPDPTPASSRQHQRALGSACSAGRKGRGAARHSPGFLLPPARHRQFLCSTERWA